MAEDYGKTPAEILDADLTGMSNMERFRVNQDIHTAVAMFKEKHSGNGDGSSGPANQQQQSQLIQKNQQRAKNRQQAEQSNQTTPGLSDQQNALKLARQKRSGGPDLEKGAK